MKLVLTIAEKKFLGRWVLATSIGRLVGIILGLITGIAILRSLKFPDHEYRDKVT